MFHFGHIKIQMKWKKGEQREKGNKKKLIQKF